LHINCSVCQSWLSVYLASIQTETWRVETDELHLETVGNIKHNTHRSVSTHRKQTQLCYIENKPIKMISQFCDVDGQVEF